jgi:hypothetical protein
MARAIKLNKEAFTVSEQFDASDERAYWHSRTPQERIEHIQLLRQINYGHSASERLQRFFEIAEQTEG